MSQSPLWFVVFLLTKFIYNPVGFLFQHRDPGSTRMWNQKFSLPAQRPGIYQCMESEVFSSAQRPRIYQDMELEVFSSSTETRDLPVHGIRSFLFQHSDPGLPGRGIRSFLFQHRDPGLPGRGIRSFLTSTEARVCQDVDSGADRRLLCEALLPVEPCVLQTRGC